MFSADGSVAVITKELPVKNVVGVMEGEGELADETIVVGITMTIWEWEEPAAWLPWTVGIHNGADDNASGYGSTLEILPTIVGSRQQAKTTYRFHRLHGGGSGLLGSHHYVRNPRFDLEKTVAMVNLDMVGRLHDDELTVYGTGTATRI